MAKRGKGGKFVKGGGKKSKGRVTRSVSRGSPRVAIVRVGGGGGSRASKSMRKGWRGARRAAGGIATGAAPLVKYGALAFGGFLGGNLIASMLTGIVPAGIRGAWVSPVAKLAVGVGAGALLRKPLGNTAAAFVAVGPVISAVADLWAMIRPTAGNPMLGPPAPALRGWDDDLGEYEVVEDLAGEEFADLEGEDFEDLAGEDFEDLGASEAEVIVAAGED